MALINQNPEEFWQVLQGGGDDEGGDDEDEVEGGDLEEMEAEEGVALAVEGAAPSLTEADEAAVTRVREGGQAGGSRASGG